MLINLLRKNSYLHLKMIHDYPQGINNRFKHTGDKWVESLRNPNIKTYYDLHKNLQTGEFEYKLHESQKVEGEERRLQSSEKPGLLLIKQYYTVFFPTRPDDPQMTRDISDMSLMKFIQEGRQKLTELHKLVLIGFGSIIVHIILYFSFVHGQGIPTSQRVKVLNAEMLQSYNFQSEENTLKLIKQRLQIVNAQYQKQLINCKLL